MKEKKEIIGKITIPKNQISSSINVYNTNHKRSNTNKLTIQKSLNNKQKFSYTSHKPNKSDFISPITQINQNNESSKIEHFKRQSTQEKRFKKYKSLSPEIKPQKYLLPPKKTNKKTLVLDLDETLVHSGFVPFDCPSDVIIQIDIEGEIHDIHVLVRPHVKIFLERMSKRFEIVIFTASLSKYANPLLNKIDNTGNCSLRLFREHCTLINTTFVKDLKKLGRNIKDIIIVDNSPLAYSLNVNNGFPIESWFYDKNDTELLKIIPILEFLSYVPDVREYIGKIVKNNKIQFDLVYNIISSYNNKLKQNQIPLSLRTPILIKSYNGNMENSNLYANSFLIKKSDSINKIKKIYVEPRNNKKNGKKALSITNVEIIPNIRLKNKFKKITKKSNISCNKDKDSFSNKTEIIRLNSSPCLYEFLKRQVTMRNNSSNKQKLYLYTNDRNNFRNPRLNNYLYNHKQILKIDIHKKNTLSMSERFRKIHVC